MGLSPVGGLTEERWTGYALQGRRGGEFGAPPEGLRKEGSSTRRPGGKVWRATVRAKVPSQDRPQWGPGQKEGPGQEGCG